MITEHRIAGCTCHDLASNDEVKHVYYCAIFWSFCASRVKSVQSLGGDQKGVYASAPRLRQGLAPAYDLQNKPCYII